jgi:hypothetical protein
MNKLEDVFAGSTITLSVERLVREYVAAEITRELSNGSVMAVRVLGEVLANKPGFSEEVSSAAAKLVGELLKPTEGK